MDDTDKLMQHYLEIGALEVVGIEDDGQFLFKLGPDAKELAPELYESWMEDVDKDLLSLYEKGLIGVEYDENLNPSFYTIDDTPL
jgi:hypothetical protein